MLYTYLQQTQRLLGDTDQKRFVPNDLIYFINQARRHVAEVTQCVRALTPISNSLTSITVLTAGVNYTSPTVTITPPDLPGGAALNPNGVQATASATVLGGSITSITLINYGQGYFQPTVTITDGAGTGATASASIAPVTQTNQGQEIYQFSAMPLPSGQGLSSILNIRTVAIIYDDYRYTLPWYSFSQYQTFVRIYPYQYSFVPTVAAQLGQGINGSLYLYPLASQAYSFQCDCICIPADLVLDTDVEAIPLPWSDSVPFYAAFLARLTINDQNGARGMLDLFDKIILRQSVGARPGRTPNRYGRY